MADRQFQPLVLADVAFLLSIGCLMRSPNHTFPEYPTSTDNLEFVKPQALADSLRRIEAVCELIEADYQPVGTQPDGEPQVGRRGQDTAPGSDHRFDQMPLHWILNQSDGRHSLLANALDAKKPFREIVAAAAALEKASLLVGRAG